MRECCVDLQRYVDNVVGLEFVIGEGEVTGRLEFKNREITIRDGFGSYPDIKFNYCPYCGTKQQPATPR